MTYSLNEIEAMAKRATRGAGYSWGLAEDAAKATRWLCSHGIDGVSVLAKTLEKGFATAPEKHRVDDPHGVWEASGILCPIMTGATLSDFGWLLNEGTVTIRNVAAPALLLPYAANASIALEVALELNCDGVSACIEGTRLAGSGTFPEHGSTVLVSSYADNVDASDTVMRAKPDMTAKGILDAFAHRTYAPASEESRMLGAGAGLSDND